MCLIPLHTLQYTVLVFKYHKTNDTAQDWRRGGGRVVALLLNYQGFCLDLFAAESPLLWALTLEEKLETILIQNMLHGSYVRNILMIRKFNNTSNFSISIIK